MPSKFTKYCGLPRKMTSKTTSHFAHACQRFTPVQKCHTRNADEKVSDALHTSRKMTFRLLDFKVPRMPHACHTK
jgi:hypothetical protein